MLGIHDYWLFVATGVLLNLTPGQDTLYILGRSIAQGRRIGVASALGISAGAVVHTVAAALGLSAVLATSASAFIALKVAGAVYLVYLGFRMLMARTAALGSTDIAGLVDIWTAFRQGMLTNILNPKVALFFLALMPQFIEPDSPAKVGAFLVLGLTFLTTGGVWCLVLALGASRLRSFFANRPRALQRFSRA
jgi:threonine/homoserine/homoserine lactone efflux protein